MASTPNPQTPPAPKPAPAKSWVDVVQPFVIGGISGCFATLCIQPIDMIKVTLQLKSEQAAIAKRAGQAFEPVTFSNTMKELYSHGGIKGFYRGIDSALARQIFYTTTRLGVYKSIFEEVKARNKKIGKNELDFSQKALCASFAGFVGSVVGNPADLALIRMQADSRLPVEQRRNYTNVFNAFSRITKEEGFFALWRGGTPTVVRAIVLNLVMLASYDEIKERLNKSFNKHDSLDIRVGASAASGVLSALASLPFDNAKTKIQKMTKNPDGTFPYKNIFDAMAKTVSNEGATKLWVGFPTFCFRIAPHVIITLVTQDLLTDYVKRMRAKH